MTTCLAGGESLAQLFTQKVKRDIPYLMKSVISSKGQVTVPVAVRAELGLEPGTPVEFLVRDGEAVMRKGSFGTHPVDAVFGRLRLRRPVDAILDDMRGPRQQRLSSSERRRKR